MSSSIAFIFVTEPGRLEGQSLLLAKSIRKFAGNLSHAPIYSFHPRKGEPIAKKTIAQFEALNVCHRQVALNVEFHDYVFANKALSCAYAEKTIDADIIVYLDSDKCILQEPSEFLLPDGYNVGLRPEFGKGIGSSGRGDKQDAYWQELYQLFNVRNERFITTPIGEKRIRAYWNGGLIAARKNAGIFTSYGENLERVLRLKIAPSQGDYFVEQSVLAVTVCALDEKAYTFSPSYNYPLPLHNRLSKSSQLERFDDIVSIHYFNMFFFNDWRTQLSKVRNLNTDSMQYEWLYEQLLGQSLPRRSWQYTYGQLQRKFRAALAKLV